MPFGILTATFIAIMAFSAWKIWEIRSEYRVGEDAYDDISHMVSLPPKTAVPQPSATSESGGAETQPDEDDTIWPEADFAALREINPDIVAWIYIEGTEINYPVVQGEDNDYYLKHLFTGEWNGSGCIFLDSRNDASFADRHSIIYGHHRKNGTMFTGLDKYKKQEFFDDHPVALLITPEKSDKVEFFAGYVAAPQDDAWEVGFTDAEFEVWLRKAVNRSCFSGEITPDVSDRILTLSTCSYEFADARFVLAGALR
ncbi:class B sortase [Yeguia hominis]|nr:class B sortase [Yeguia hominis]